jgi:peroxiredoxin Q/BCP
MRLPPKEFAMNKSLITEMAIALTGGVLMFGVAAAEELKVGDVAPEFTLPGSDGKTYKLSDYRGKQAVVLAWFPRAFTPGCTTECKVMAQHGSKLKKFDVAYFTASVDRPEKNKDFAKSVGADYPILSDPGGHVARAYGVTGTIQKWASRWTFYIGIDGKILFIDKNVHPLTHADDVAAKLKELGMTEKKSGEG